jgi:hypothetical protein
VNEVALLLQLILGGALVAAPIVLIVWLLAGRQDASLADLFAPPGELPWPRGIQEEEPEAWNLHALERRRPTTRGQAAPDHLRGPRVRRTRPA